MANISGSAPIQVANPASNVLPESIKLEDVIESVRKSGYPLQTVVAEKLRGRFGLQEEWSFIDTDTKDLRSLDILAHRPLYDVNDPNKYRVRPILSLLMECKQSDLPYVFFVSHSPLATFEYPAIAGLFGNEVKIKSDDDGSTWNEPLVVLLGYRMEPFLSAPPNSSVTFSKCVRKGKGLELSGSEAFLSIVMPLIKAMKHFLESQQPPRTARYHDLHITLPVGVLDAPMLGVKFENGQPEVTSIPWVRVFRHESVEAKERSDRSRLYALDLVHKDFLDEYLDNYALPFAQKFAETSCRHDLVLASLEGFIPGMGADPWTDLEKRLQPRGLLSKAKDAAQDVLVEVLKTRGIDIP